MAPMGARAPSGSDIYQAPEAPRSVHNHKGPAHASYLQALHARASTALVMYSDTCICNVLRSQSGCETSCSVHSSVDKVLLISTDRIIIVLRTCICYSTLYIVIDTSGDRAAAGHAARTRAGALVSVAQLVSVALAARAPARMYVPLS